MASYTVRVKPDFEHAHVQVAGKHFVKSETVVLGEADLIDEIKNSPLLLIEPLVEVGALTESSKNTPPPSDQETTKAVPPTESKSNETPPPENGKKKK